LPQNKALSGKGTACTGWHIIIAAFIKTMDKIAVITGLITIIGFSGRNVADGIFNAGFWVAMVVVAFLAGLIVFSASRNKK
jgi:hypothetical protein